MHEIADGIFIETEYEGVNVGAIVTNEGLVCIDTPSYPRDARDWIMGLERIHAKPVRFLILTDANGDRILNTRWFNAAIIAQEGVAETLLTYEKRYPLSIIDSLNQRNPKQGRELANSPVEQVAISFDQDLTIAKQQDQIVLMHKPGPTSGNAWVYVPDKKVLFTGDGIANGSPPFLADMNLWSWLDTLSQFNTDKFPVKIVVPGRGDIGDDRLLGQMRDFLFHIQSSIAQIVDAGGSPAAISSVADSLIEEFPSASLPEEWVRCQYLKGLNRVYDKLAASDAATVIEKVSSTTASSAQE